MKTGIKSLMQSRMPLIVAVLLSTFGSTVASAQVKSVTMDDILAGWKKRAEKVRTLRCTWTVTRTDRAGSLPDLWKSDKKQSRSLPPADSTYGSEQSLLVEGPRMRHRFDGQIWYLGRNEQRLNTYTTDQVSDGNTKRWLNYNHASSANKFGWISNRPSLNLQSQMMGNPLFWYLHPLDSVFRLAEGRPLPQLVNVKKPDASGIIRVEQRIGERALYIFDIDVRRDYHIVQMIKMSGGTERARLTVDYEPHATHGYVPKGWSLISFDRDGAEKSVNVAKVTSFELDVPLTSEDFELSFQPGMIVREEGAGREFHVNDAGDLVVPGSQTESSRNRWILVGLAMLVVGAVLLVVRRRFRVA